MFPEPSARPCWWSVRELAAAACLVSACSLAIGCSGKGGGVPASGQVQLDGAPLSAGSVVFRPAGEVSAQKVAAQVTDGQFTFHPADGLLPGSYRVEVYADPPADLPLDDPVAFAQAGLQALPANAVAPRFNSRTELEVTVHAQGTNQFHFQVETTQDASRRR